MGKRRRVIGSILAGCISFVSTLGMFGAQGGVLAAEPVVRDTVGSVPQSGYIMIGVEGVDDTSAQQEMIDLINQVRYEACYDGKTPDPRDKSRMLQPGDYVPMQLGVNSTKAAQIRSAEASVYLGHTRPNGNSCFEVARALDTRGGSRGENLAWNSQAGSVGGIKQWIAERNAYLRLEFDQSGHYSSIINPSFRYTGMATFNPVNDNVSFNWSCTAGEYASEDTPVESYAGAQNQRLIQKMEVPVSSVTNLDITGENILITGNEEQLNLLATVFFDGVAKNTVIDCPVYDGITWSSSNPSVLSVNENGKVNALRDGSATITAVIGEGSSAIKKTMDFTVSTERVTIESVLDPDVITVESFTKPVLPKNVTAVLSNGETTQVGVEWDEYDAKNLQVHLKSNDFTIGGKAKGFDVTQKIHVNAAKVTKVYAEPASVTTDYGTEPVYPTASVAMSNGYRYYDLPVNWDEKCLDYCNVKAGGTFEVTGRTAYGLDADDGPAYFDVTFELIVNPAPDDVVNQPDPNNDDNTTNPDLNNDDNTTNPDLNNDDNTTNPDLNNDNNTINPDLNNDDNTTNPDRNNDDNTTNPDLNNDDNTTNPDLNNDDNITNPDLNNDDETTNPDQNNDDRTTNPAPNNNNSGNSGNSGTVTNQNGGSGSSVTPSSPVNNTPVSQPPTVNYNPVTPGSSGSGSFSSSQYDQYYGYYYDDDDDFDDDDDDYDDDDDIVKKSTSSTTLPSSKKSSITKLKSKKKTITVKWKKVSSGITGYQIQYSTSKKFKTNKKSVKITNKKTVSKTIKGLKKGKKIYVRIRTYKKSGSKTKYSKWSAVKSVKVK